MPQLRAFWFELDSIPSFTPLSAVPNWLKFILGLLLLPLCAGAVPALLPPGRNNAFEARMDPIPAVGEHTTAILREIGWDDARIQALMSPPASA